MVWRQLVDKKFISSSRSVNSSSRSVILSCCVFYLRPLTSLFFNSSFRSVNSSSREVNSSSRSVISSCRLFVLQLVV